MIILKPQEIRALLEKAATQKDKVLFMTAVSTGVREGELISLQWGDVDWLNSQLHIRRTFNHGKIIAHETGVPIPCESIRPENEEGVKTGLGRITRKEY